MIQTQKHKPRSVRPLASSERTPRGSHRTQGPQENSRGFSAPWPPLHGRKLAGHGPAQGAPDPRARPRSAPVPGGKGGGTPARPPGSPSPGTAGTRAGEGTEGTGRRCPGTPGPARGPSRPRNRRAGRALCAGQAPAARARSRPRLRRVPPARGPAGRQGKIHHRAQLGPTPQCPLRPLSLPSPPSLTLGPAAAAATSPVTGAGGGDATHDVPTLRASCVTDGRALFPAHAQRPRVKPRGVRAAGPGKGGSGKTGRETQKR